MNFPGGFGFMMGGPQGPQVPEEIVDQRPEGMDAETASRLYINARGDGYFGRGRSDKLPGDRDIFEIYDAGFNAGEWSRKVDLANNVEIIDPLTQEDFRQSSMPFSEAPLKLKAQHILQHHAQELGAACLAAVSLSATLFFLRKTLID
jgi:hypothetical protein